MTNVWSKIAFVFIGLLILCCDGEAQAGQLQSPYAILGSQTAVPYGWVDFCSRRPDECSVPRLPPVDVKVTADVWEVLVRINRQVNASIEPISNFDHWGTLLDHWDYPVDGKGEAGFGLGAIHSRVGGSVHNHVGLKRLHGRQQRVWPRQVDPRATAMPDNDVYDSSKI